MIPSIKSIRLNLFRRYFLLLGINEVLLKRSFLDKFSCLSSVDDNNGDNNEIRKLQQDHNRFLRYLVGVPDNFLKEF